MSGPAPALRTGNTRNKKNRPAAPESRPGLPARQCAARLLGAVIERKTSLDGLTDNSHGHPQYLALDDRDRALVRAILGSALRNRGTIEAALASFMDRPLPENAVALKQLLHVAAAQILYLDLPDHSAVDLAVTAANSDPRNRRYASLVNAVLRRLSREKDAIQPAESNAPAWFSDMLAAAYGKQKAEAILHIQALEPAIDLTVKGDPAEWAGKLDGYLLPNGSVRLSKIDSVLTELPGFAEGDWWVQDAAASLPARLLGDIKGKRVADLCAAPGGKTAQLAHAGARVTALDISANRLKRLIGNLERLGLSAETAVSDLKDYAPDELFDAVLLDAPCSSTGTVRRHPDVPWTKSQEDVAKLAELQRELLGHAIRLTRPGGIVVFSNCSLDPLEGEEVARATLAENGSVTSLPFAPDELPGIAELVTPEGFLRTTPIDFPNENPSLAGMDGFFAARFKRK
ncbi:MAG: RsmB/NOP family class I SAM-dependent RNA methyltransferase [Phyllobacterium sp.]